MNCEQTRKRLDELLDGELSDRDKKAVEQHVATCDACRVELDVLTRTAKLVRSLPRAEVPAGLARSVRATIARQATVRSRAMLWRWAHVGGWIAAAATLVVVIRYGPWETATNRTPTTTPMPSVSGRMETEKGASPAPEKKESAVGKDKDMPGYYDDRSNETDHVRDSLRRVEPGTGVGGGEGRPPMMQKSRAPSAERFREEAGDKADDEFRDAATLKAAEPAREAAPSKLAKAPPATPAPALPQVQLTYECGDINRGLADVRSAVAAVRGEVAEGLAGIDEVNEEQVPESLGEAAKETKLDSSEAGIAEKGKDRDTKPADNVIVASVPVDKLGALLDRLDLSGRRGSEKQAAEKPADEAEEPTEDADVFGRQQTEQRPDVGQHAQQAGRGQRGEPQQDRRKAATITVRIIIKVKPQE